MKSVPVESAPAGADTNAPVDVAHVIESLGAGGAERLLYTNLKHLVGERVRSVVYTVFSHAEHWAEPLRQLGVPVISLNCRGFRDVPVGVMRLRAWLQRRRPDLIHSHLWAANVAGRLAGRLSGIPVISSIHCPDHEPEAWNDGSEVSLRKRHLARDIDRWTARLGCERMIAVSEYVRQSAHRQLRFPLERIELIYNPIDVDAFRPGGGPGRAELLGQYGIGADDQVLLNVGRVSPAKGFLYAVRALPAILRQHPRAQLVSIGGTTDRQWLARLEDEARELGVAARVHFLGPQRDVAAFLRSCDLFIFPSLYEGLGIALIEAMAAGCACVAAETGPIPEVVRHDVDGWLVEPGNVESLSAGVCALLADGPRREALGRVAKSSALARFRPQPAAAQLASFYRLVLREPRSHIRSFAPRQRTGDLR